VALPPATESTIADFREFRDKLAAMRHILRLALMTLASLCLLPAGIGSAQPSCLEPDRAAVDAADAAGVGTVLGDNSGVWVIDITEDTKGNLPDQVPVLAPDVDWTPGRDIAALYYVDETTDGRVVLRTDACSQTTASLLRDWTPGPDSAPPAELALSETPSIGGWSPWLIVLGLLGGVAYVAKKAQDPEWRSSWSKPNNARNAGSVRRRDDESGPSHFGR
jgi:hypothetical protein